MYNDEKDHILDNVFVTEEDKINFEKCQEHRQIGYLCDAYSTCQGCPYQIPNEIYAALGGKLIK